MVLAAADLLREDGQHQREEQTDDGGERRAACAFVVAFDHLADGFLGAFDRVVAADGGPEDELGVVEMQFENSHNGMHDASALSRCPRADTYKRNSLANVDMDGRPLDVLEEALQSEVSVRLKDGEEYHGVLTGYDQHMNVVLSPPEETDIPYDAFETPPVEDTTVIRGDNVVVINA